MRLRTKVSLLFGVIALIATVSLTVVTYAFARSSLLEQRWELARTQAVSNALRVRERLRSGDSIGDWFPNLRVESPAASPPPSSSNDETVPTDTRFSYDSFPDDLLPGRRDRGVGRAALRRSAASSYVGVGVKIAEVDANYFEAFPLGPTEDTLRTILVTLVIGSLVTVLLASFVGWWTSGRLLRPLGRITDAAGEIAAGDLDTRVVPEGDPDLDRLADSFNDMADAVQARIEREARFASDVSHELRSPITALAAAAEVIDGRRGELPDRTQQALDVVVGQVRRFDAMVIDLLELSRIDAGATDLHTEEVEIETLCRRVAAAQRLRPPADRGHQGPGHERGADDRHRRPAALRADPHQPAGERLAPRRRPDPRLDRADRRPVPARRRGGRRAGRGPRRAGADLRALRPRQRRPPPHRHRPRPRARRRARHRAGRRGVGRGPPGRRRPLRRAPAGRERPVRRLAATAAGAVLLVVLVASCGIGADSQLQTIDQDALLGLDETTTSTTSTTTIPASVPAVVESTVAATSTTIATESVQLFFVDGTRLQPVTIDLAGTATPDRVVQALLAGRPLGEIGIGLRTLLPPGLVNSPVVDSGAGYVTVDLATEPFNRIDPADQRTAIAQIVMTLVSRPGIGQVQLHARRRAAARPAPRRPAERARRGCLPQRLRVAARRRRPADDDRRHGDHGGAGRDAAAGDPPPGP